MPLILIYEPVENPEPYLPLLEDRGHQVILCRNRETFVDALAHRRPDVLVYVIQRLEDDMGLLSLLRQMAPTLPLILFGGPTDLAHRRAIQELRPLYYGVLPFEGNELSDAVRGALHRVR